MPLSQRALSPILSFQTAPDGPDETARLRYMRRILRMQRTEIRGAAWNSLA